MTSLGALPRLAQLQDVERDWVSSVLGDPDYRTALRARHPMTHRRLRRAVYASTEPPASHEGRTGFPVGPGSFAVPSGRKEAHPYAGILR